MSAARLGYANVGVSAPSGLLDVQSCYSDILVDRTMDWSDTKMKTALLAITDKSLWQQSKTSDGASVAYGPISAANDYESFDAQRRHEFDELKKSLAYERETASASFRLNSQAGAILQRCLDRQAKDSLGLHAAFFQDGPRVSRWNCIDPVRECMRPGRPQYIQSTSTMRWF